MLPIHPAAPNAPSLATKIPYLSKTPRMTIPATETYTTRHPLRPLPIRPWPTEATRTEFMERTMLRADYRVVREIGLRVIRLLGS